MRRKSNPIAAIIFGTIFLFVGGALVYFLGWPMIAEAKASQSWPATSGKITVSKVDSQIGNGNAKTMYSHHIEYTYTVDGVGHTGDRVWASDGWKSSSSSPAKRTVAKYPVGSETTVYYDPEAPDNSVLQTGTTWMTYLAFGIGGLFFLVGGLVAGTSALKLILGGLMIGAAATGAVGKSFAPAAPNHPRNNDQSLSPTDDDGIEIT